MINERKFLAFINKWCLPKGYTLYKWHSIKEKPADRPVNLQIEFLCTLNIRLEVKHNFLNRELLVFQFIQFVVLKINLGVEIVRRL